MELRSPIFIGGTGRSGTTIISKMIASHPLISDVPETRFTVDPGGVYSFISQQDVWSPYKSHESWKELNKMFTSMGEKSLFDDLISKVEKKYFSSFNFRMAKRYSNNFIPEYAPNFGKILNGFKNEIESFVYSMTWVGQNRFTKNKMTYLTESSEEVMFLTRKFLNEIYHDICLNQNVPIYFDTNTWNILNIEMIKRLWPDFKLVCIHRDPYQVINSFSKQSWMPSNINQSTRIYLDLINRFNSNKQDYSDSILELNFEDFGIDPEAQMKKIFSFYGVKYSDSWRSVPFDFDRIIRPISKKVYAELKNNKELDGIRSKYSYKGKV